MKTDKQTPGTCHRAEGKSKWQTNSDGDPYTPEGEVRLGYRQCSDDGIADSVSRLLEPPSTHAVILKVRACIALRGLPLPEVVFVSPEPHPITCEKYMTR